MAPRTSQRLQERPWDRVRRAWRGHEEAVGGKEGTMGNYAHGTTYVRVAGDDGELRPSLSTGGQTRKGGGRKGGHPSHSRLPATPPALT